MHQVNKTRHHVKLVVSYDLYLLDRPLVISFFLKKQAQFESKFPFFDFDSDMDPWPVARAFAKEPWSRDYFDRIRG